MIYAHGLIVDTTPRTHPSIGAAPRAAGFKPPPVDTSWIVMETAGGWRHRRYRLGVAPVEIPEALTDADVAWVNEQLALAGLRPAVRACPVIDLTPDPRLSQIIPR